MNQLTITSPAYQPNQQIPDKYTCKGQNINPPLSIEGAPEGTKSLALTFTDPDAPSGTFDHWIAWNIAPSTNKIAENTAPGTEGLNSGGENGYTSPCPPRGTTHRYIFRVYAVDAQLDLEAGSTRKDLEKALKGHVIAEGELLGLFSR